MSVFNEMASLVDVELAYLLHSRFLIFERSEAMSASGHFLKLKINVTDFDNAIPAKQRVSFRGDINRVPIGEESATARTAQDGAGTKKLEGKLRRRWRGSCRRHVIWIPWYWNPDNFRRGRGGQHAAEDITDCWPIFRIPGSLNAITVDPWTLNAHRFVGDQKRTCACRSQFGVSVVIPNGSRDEHQHGEDRAFDFAFFLQTLALKYAFKCKSTFRLPEGVPPADSLVRARLSTA